MLLSHSPNELVTYLITQSERKTFFGTNQLQKPKSEFLKAKDEQIRLIWIVWPIGT